MALDREAALKQGEKFLRQGRLDAAIAEYLQVATAHPQDWNTANLLGDLYVRAQQIDAALPYYHRIGEHLMHEGRHAKAATLYKKVLKLRPDDEPTQMLLAELAAIQGQLAEAKAYLTAVSERRRGRGDRDGAAEVAQRLATLDPADIPTRLAAARTLEEMGRPGDAAGHFRNVYADLQSAGKSAEALAALRDAVRLNGSDREGRTILARHAVEAGDVMGAQPWLDRETAAADPTLLAALVEIELRTGHRDAARALMTDLLAAQPGIRHRLLNTAWALTEADPEAAYLCVDAVVDTAIAGGHFAEAAQHLESFAAKRPHHVPGLLRLVEVCVDGDLRPMLPAAQGRLADAYLESGQAVEARAVAEDLLSREPQDSQHVDRLRRALIALQIEDPERQIANLLASLPEFEPLDLDGTDGSSDADTRLIVEATSPVEAVSEAPDDARRQPLDSAGGASAVPVPAAGTVMDPGPVIPVIDEAAAVAVSAAHVESFSTSADRTEPPVVRAASEPAIKLSPLPPEVEPVVRLTSAAGEGSELAAAEAPSAGSDLMSMIGSAVAEETGAAASDEFFEDVDLSFLLGGDAPETAAGGSRGTGPGNERDRSVGGGQGEAVGDDAEEFAAQYVKLAQTYVDMGMDDEAISSLQTAVKSRKHRFEAASLLGRLYMRQGKSRQAIEWLSKAADTPAPTVQEGRALLYDLGVMLDGAGDPGRALAVFLELQAEAGDFKDVPSRIDRLARVESGG